MEIYIELIVGAVIAFIIFCLISYYIISKLILLRKYKPINDKSRKGGIVPDKGATDGAKPTIDNASRCSVRPEQSGEPELLPETEVNDVGKDSNRSGKRSSNLGRFLKRINKK